MSQQQALTLITPIRSDKLEPLYHELRTIKQELFNSKHEVFENIGSIHFARWIILKPASSGERGIAQLAFSSNYDVETESHIAALSSVAASFIDRIYQFCEGYPVEGARTPQSRTEYLQQWQVNNIGFYVGAPGRTLDQIRKESALQTFIRAYLNITDFTGKSSQQVQQSIKEKVLANPEFKWVKEKVKIPATNYLALIIPALLLLLLLPFILIWLLIIEFFFERHDKPLGLTPSQLNESHLRELEEYEDWENQNQFTQVLTMKPGLFRLLTLQGFMLLARQLIKAIFVNGKLMGIPTIHFARWVMMENNKRMLFLSNFDGSWQQYLGDFIDKSGWGLTGIWSNSEGFPKTRFTFWGGAHDEEHFLAWSRYYEIPTQVWYSAYPHLSIKNINNNTMIRMELIKDLDEKQAADFLKRL